MVAGTCGDPFAIRGESHGENFAGVLITGGFIAGGHVAEGNETTAIPVAVAGGERPAVGGECDRPHIAGMSLEIVFLFPSVRFPNPDSPVTVAGSNVFSIGADTDGPHFGIGGI